MPVFSSADIQSWERFYRTHFINSLSGFKPVSLIGTVNANGITNLGVFSNIVHIGADPALVGFINRPREAAPHTIANIEATGYFTINHIHPDMVAQAHQCSAKYEEGISEFDATGLHTDYVDGFAAPFVQESRVKYGLSLQQVIPIELNRTFLVIGKVELAIVPEEAVQADGLISLEQCGSMCSAGIDAYYTTTVHSRYAYAKPDRLPVRIDTTA